MVIPQVASVPVEGDNAPRKWDTLTTAPMPQAAP